MADNVAETINAMIALYNSKKREFQAEIEQIDKSLEQLRRWSAAPAPQRPQGKPKLKQEEGKTVRDIVLNHLNGRSTFKLLELVNEISTSGSIQGERSAVYGTITSMLRRNPHIFVRVRRGIWRVKSLNQPSEQATSALNTEQSNERSETTVH